MHPFDNLFAITAWAAGLGYKGVQIPSWDRRLFDLNLCAESQTYADEVVGICAEAGIAITELSTHCRTVSRSESAYDAAFDAFAPETVRGNPGARQAWAVDQGDQGRNGGAASGAFGNGQLHRIAGLPHLYPWPQRPAGLVETAFAELARRWTPIP